MIVSSNIISFRRNYLTVKKNDEFDSAIMSQHFCPWIGYPFLAFIESISLFTEYNQCDSEISNATNSNKSIPMGKATDLKTKSWNVALNASRLNLHRTSNDKSIIIHTLPMHRVTKLEVFKFASHDWLLFT